MAKDWYPNGMDARAAWHQNFADNIGLLKTKYNLTTAQVTQATEDNEWMQFWVQARHTLDAQSQQLSKYFNDIAGSDVSVDPLTVINIFIRCPEKGIAIPSCLTSLFLCYDSAHSF